MFEQNQLPNFEQEVLPHLDTAYNLARWLTRNDQDAQDVVQEAYLRAFRFFPGFRGGDARAWLMKIVRNTCYTWLHVNRPLQDAAEFDENFFPPDSRAPNPEEVVLQNDSAALLRKALEKLPPNSREVLILRTRRDVLQGDRRYHRHACGHRDVELVPCPGPPSSSSDRSYDPSSGAEFRANRRCERVIAWA